ncbi:MAG: DegV family protein [Lachnospiraceae bacterium]|nr:DegV family protein [Lachnospiraceae bacterium]
MKTAVVTDSNSGIFGPEARALGIHVVPMPIIIEGHTFFENENLKPGDFYDALISGRETGSSQPSPASLFDIWDVALQNADELIYIPMSSGLSGSCNTALALSDEYEGRVCVADNHRISVTLRGAVDHAVKLAAEGKSALEIKQALEEDAKNSSIYLTVETLKFFKKTGRITPATALIGDILSIKPVLYSDGDTFEAVAKVRGTAKARQSLIDMIKHDRENKFADHDDKDIWIMGAGSFVDQADAESWRLEVTKAFPGYDIMYDPLSLSIACHTGPNAFGAGIMLKH